MSEIWLGAIASLLLAWSAWKAKTATRSGAVVGGILALGVLMGFGFAGLVLLAVFVASASAATRVGQRRKEALAVAQSDGGRRNARHAIANCGVATAAALTAAVSPDGLTAACALAFAAALATALADTGASEIGQLTNAKTWLITGWKEVQPGRDGGVSLLGSSAALLGSAIIAIGGWIGDLYGPAPVFLVTICGMIGCVADSVLGATLEQRGLLDNHGVNLLATAIGALLAFVVGVSLSS